MHTGVSGCGHQLVRSDEEGIAHGAALPLLPARELASRAAGGAAGGARAATAAIAELIPADENKPFDIKALIAALVDEGSLLEIHPRWAKEIVVGFARLDGQRRRDRRQPAQAQGRRAVLRLRRQGRALHLDLQRVQRARCCSSPTCPGS